MQLLSQNPSCSPEAAAQEELASPSLGGARELSLSATLRAVGALWLHLSARPRGDGWLSSDDKIEVGGGAAGTRLQPQGGHGRGRGAQQLSMTNMV